MITATRVLGFICAWAACDRIFPIPDVPDKRPVNAGPPVIETNTGRISGYYMSTITSKVIGAYEGIPYAESPTGDLRFRNPVRKRSWNGTLRANRRIKCIQMDPTSYYRVVGQEDCLVLNVYVPMLQNWVLGNKYFPVLVWIHGGSYFWGSGSQYGPAYLVDHDVILVTLNYRLGPLGFYSSDDPEVPGNFGLKDQAMALRWVKENIKHFGGNPQKITLMGQSAGGAAVHLHMMSPLSRGNFQHAISLSGTALSFWATPQNQTAHANRWLKIVGCSPIGRRRSNVIHCLRQKSARRLVSTQYDLFEVLENPSVLFGPVIEPVNTEAFLVESPDEIYRKGKVAKVPWMTGILKDEGELYTLVNYAAPLAIRKLVKNLDQNIPIMLDYNRNYTKYTSMIKKFYFGSSPKFSYGGFEASKSISQMIGDRFFYVPFHNTLQTHSKAVAAPLYAYHFTYDGTHSLAEKVYFHPAEWGVMHQDELQYLFNCSELFHALDTATTDYQISKYFINLVLNFATTGTPNKLEWSHHSKFYSSGKTNTWEPYTFASPNLLQINTNIAMTQEPNLRRINFWKTMKNI